MKLREMAEEMETRLNEILMAGDYKISTYDQYTAELLVENEFKVRVWITNDPGRNFGLHDTGIFYHVLNSEKWTLAERMEAWEVFAKKQNKIIAKENKKRLEALKKEVAEIEATMREDNEKND